RTAADTRFPCCGNFATAPNFREIDGQPRCFHDLYIGGAWPDGHSRACDVAHTRQSGQRRQARRTGNRRRNRRRRSFPYDDGDLRIVGVAGHIRAGLRDRQICRRHLSDLSGFQGFCREKRQHRSADCAGYHPDAGVPTGFLHRDPQPEDGAFLPGLPAAVHPSGKRIRHCAIRASRSHLRDPQHRRDLASGGRCRLDREAGCAATAQSADGRERSSARSIWHWA
ncbi:Homoserine/homoserine lactone efflux protein, putative, partial [Ricinus communis]